MSFQVKLHGVSKRYGRTSPLIFQPIDLNLSENETVAIVGPSGCGKTTLLNIIGLLDDPSSGVYEWCHQDVSAWSAKQRALVRNQSLGFIFQASRLINHYTVIENCILPLSYRGLHEKYAQEEAKRFLRDFNMLDLANRHPNELSGGQQQRVGIIRALISKPKMILADEPTSALDETTKESVLSTLFSLQKDYQFGLVLVTHDPGVAIRCERRFELVQS